MGSPRRATRTQRVVIVVDSADRNPKLLAARRGFVTTFYGTCS